MNVLIIGSGGRENAIAWKISQSKLLTKLYCAPGNPGTSKVAQNLQINITDFHKIKELVLQHKIELVVVGPEEPLVNGLRDFFLADEQLRDVLFVGPCSKGARLEGSKDFAKEFMVKYNIPTAAYSTFGPDQYPQAIEFMKSLEAPYVIKADGLAAGKGVVIADSLDQASSDLKLILDGKFGKAGNKVVIEEFLHGIEMSLFVLTDGKNHMVLPEAKDYKRIGDGDKGPNTGGMGAVSPVPFANDEFMHKVEQNIVLPTLKGLRQEDIDYRGFLFIGLMNCNGNPYVIEYNVRMGDPETEAVMPRIKSDLLSHLIASAKGELNKETLEKDPSTALTVMLVSGGYPGEYSKGHPIEIDRQMDKKIVFHAGTTIRDGSLVTSGGRVIAITQLGSSIDECQRNIYEDVAKIRFKGMNYRKDIGNDIKE
ncbi:MAG: phosphoribosylamine--glycine ligase [Bacteroidales bacterium]|nr:phosphoribosylamine--glycine ligase [Bacteroidales bacterium]MDD3843209.1 phosphoribosylamine--glycine ligase [Bacteroidales bacterium]MDD4618074.1 phosphoribosylamine--glycine ligase [Bacteroidales bacterium]